MTKNDGQNQILSNQTKPLGNAQISEDHFFLWWGSKISKIYIVFSAIVILLACRKRIRNAILVAYTEQCKICTFSKFWTKTWSLLVLAYSDGIVWHTLVLFDKILHWLNGKWDYLYFTQLWHILSLPQIVLPDWVKNLISSKKKLLPIFYSKMMFLL